MVFGRLCFFLVWGVWRKNGCWNSPFGAWYRFDTVYHILKDPQAAATSSRRSIEELCELLDTSVTYVKCPVGNAPNTLRIFCRTAFAVRQDVQ